MSSVGILGTGMVGQALAFRAAEVGYHVTVGARTAGSASLAPFAGRDRVTTGSFAEAAAAAPLLVNATHGAASLDALGQAGAANLAGKTLLDLSNDLGPPDADGGYPVPRASPESSLGVRIQRAFPGARVVKALHTMANQVMVHPETVPGDHVVFLSGDSAEAKAEVCDLLRAFGWRDRQFVDLGGIDSAPASEMLMALWLRIAVGRGWTAPPFNWVISSAG